MNILDSITIGNTENRCVVSFYHGDLTAIRPEESVDLLVVSAFPDDYWPTNRSLVGALDAVGVSVRDLAANKAIDLRSESSCWLSNVVQESGRKLGFKRILCFERSLRYSEKGTSVSDIFKSIFRLRSEGYNISSLAMPIIASGDQGMDAAEMIVNMLNAILEWLGRIPELREIRIVEMYAPKAIETSKMFSVIKNEIDCNRIPISIDWTKYHIPTDFRSSR